MSVTHDAATSGSAAGIERVIASLLLCGGLASFTLVVVGLVSYIATGGIHTPAAPGTGLGDPGLARHVFISLSQIVAGVWGSPVDPLAVIALGLVALLSTPVLAVALAAGAFAVRQDRTYSAIAGLVLLILLMSFAVGGRPG